MQCTNCSALEERNTTQSKATYNDKLYIGILTKPNGSGMSRVNLMLAIYQLSFVLSHGYKGNRECFLSASD